MTAPTWRRSPSADSWCHPAPLAISLTICAGLVVALAVLLGCPQLVVFAAPMIGLVSVGWRAPAASTRVVTASAAPTRCCFEAESIDVRVDFDIPPDARGALTVQVVPVAGLSTEIRTRTAGSVTIGVTAERWGLYSIPVQVSTVTCGGLAVVHSRSHPVRLLVYPLVAADSVLVPGVSSRLRVGQHRSRVLGPGLEFAGIRAFTPGDELRTVNWRATARRGSLQATERYLELANDIVVVFDETLHTIGSAAEPLDRAVRGAAELTWSALRAGDRVGLVRIGERAGWYPTRGGRQQFYGIVAALLDPDNGPATRFTGTVAPPAAIPAGATVVALSAMLDSGFGLSLIELSKRGHRVLVVDVMPESLFAADQDPLIERLWAFERAGMYRDMGIAGVEVLGWGGAERISEVIGIALRRSDFRWRAQ
ncbi:DUF58 domain-containing protein [Nocardia sp. NPDC046473]|uniref:DUF58 domain-containing protein n=1 Tax=Nocardia sp. NPDC046473 TaxID=3155733 RepID=UPI0033CF68D2